MAPLYAHVEQVVNAENEQYFGLTPLHLGLWLVAASRTDATGRPWDAHLPFHLAAQTRWILRWLAVVPECPMALDGIYEGRDSEFLDMTALEESLDR
jgi:hypothetical protein